MADKYVYESTTVTDADEKPIVRTYTEEKSETFTIKQLEEKIARIEAERDAYVVARNAEIVEVQAKIDEATAALVTK